MSLSHWSLQTDYEFRELWGPELQATEEPWGAPVAMSGSGSGPSAGASSTKQGMFSWSLIVSPGLESSDGAEAVWLGWEKIFIIVNKLARARHLMERVMSGSEGGRLLLPVPACNDGWEAWGAWRHLCFQRQGIFSQGKGLVETG